MADLTKPPQSEAIDQSLRVGIYKCIVNEFAENLMSLRLVEWKVAVQTFSGYVLIAIGYFSLLSSNVHAGSLRVWAIALVWLVALVSLLFQYRLQLSMHRARVVTIEFRNRMLYILDDHIEVPSLPLERWYGYICQQMLSLAAASTLTIVLTASQVGGAYSAHP